MEKNVDSICANSSFNNIGCCLDHVGRSYDHPNNISDHSDNTSFTSSLQWEADRQHWPTQGYRSGWSQAFWSPNSGRFNLESNYWIGVSWSSQIYLTNSCHYIWMVGNRSNDHHYPRRTGHSDQGDSSDSAMLGFSSRLAQLDCASLTSCTSAVRRFYASRSESRSACLRHTWDTPLCQHGFRVVLQAHDLASDPY